MNICSHVYKADLQNKLNLVARQVICALQSEVDSLEEEEFSFLRPNVQDMKYLQENLESLKIETKRLHRTEDALLKKEQLFRHTKLREFQAKNSQPASDLEKRKSAEEWLRSEAEGSLKLDLHARRLRKQLEDLKKNKSCNKTWLKDSTAVQLRLAKKLEKCTKSLAELERENRKLKDAAGSKIIGGQTQKGLPPSPEAAFDEMSQSFGINSDTLREQNFQLKQRLRNDISPQALQALARELEKLLVQYDTLRGETKFLDSAIVESKKFAERLNNKIVQKRGLENEQSQTREDLVTRADSQKSFIVELHQRKEATQSQVNALNNQEPLLCKKKQNIRELESMSESSAYAKKELKKTEEEHNKIFTLQQWLLEKLLAQQSLATDLERQLKQQVNNTAVEEEKAELKQVARDLFEDLQRQTESEKKTRNGKNLRNKQLEDLAKEAKSVEERLESRKAERQNVEREQKTLIQQLEQITEVCETSQKEFFARKERAAALESQVQAVQAELSEAHWSCEAEMQENEALRKQVIDMVAAMQQKSQLDNKN